MWRVVSCLALMGVVGCSKPTTTEGTVSGPAPDSAIAEMRNQSDKNLRAMVAEIGQFHDATARLPGDVTDATGKPLLSWRVHVSGITYLFKLDEPWDSPHNKKLIEQMPKVLAPVRGMTKPGETYYRRFVGMKAAMWPTGGRQPGMEMRDGVDNTIAIVEAGEPVIWTKPEDLPFDPDKPLPKLGGMFDGEFSVVTFDATVHRIRKDFDPTKFKAAITMDSGDAFVWKDLTVSR